MESKAILFVTVFLVVFVSYGSALKCYNCLSANQSMKACEDPADTIKISNHTCTGVCVKLTVVGKWKTNTTVADLTERKCFVKNGDKTECEELKEDYISKMEEDNVKKTFDCHTCKDDNCNSSPTLISSIVISVTAFICVILFS